MKVGRNEKLDGFVAVIVITVVGTPHGVPALAGLWDCSRQRLD